MCARDIYALCVALPKSFAETLYGQTKSLLEDSVSLLSEVCVTHSHIVNVVARFIRIIGVAEATSIILVVPG